MSTPAADWTSHHIEGYARAAMEAGEDGYFSAPLISHIEGNLWTGGCRDGVRLDDDFDYVVSLYPWEKYALGPHTERIEVTMHDVGDMPDPLDLAQAVNAAYGALARGGKTLVHCQAGLNRSGLVAALALRKTGLTSADAVALLRERRSPMVLCNRTFADYLASLDEQDQRL